MKEIKRVFVESKQYGVEEIQFKNWKNIRVYINYEGYKKQGAIEVREDGFYLEGIRGEKTDRGIEFKNTKWLGAYIGFNNDHCVVVEFAEEKKEVVEEEVVEEEVVEEEVVEEEVVEEEAAEEISFEYKREGLFLLVGRKVRGMAEIRHQGKYWLVENSSSVFKTEEQAVAEAKKNLVSEYKKEGFR